MKRRTAALLVILIFAWGAMLRGVEVVSKNYIFGFDHGRDYLAAQSIADKGKLTLIGAEVGAGSAGLTGLFHGPGYYYLVTAAYLLFRQDPYGMIVIMFLFGMATLGFVFVSVRSMLGIRPAVLALFLTAVSPLIVSQSRFFWNHHPSSIFIVVTLYLVYRINDNPGLFAPLSVLIAGLIYHFELAIAVPMVLSVLIAMPIVYRIRDVRTYLLSFAAAFTAFLPMLLFEVRHGFMTTGGLVKYLTHYSSSPTPVWMRLRDHILDYVSNATGTFANETRLVPGWFLIIYVVLLFILTVRCIRNVASNRTRRFFSYGLLAVMVSYGIFFLLNNAVWDYYLIHIHFIIIYFTAFTVGLLTSGKKDKVSAAFLVMTAAVITGSVFSSAYRMWLNLTYDIRDFGGMWKIAGKHMAIDAAYEMAGGKPFNVMIFSAPVYTYPYDYLFETYGKRKYGFVPGREKAGTVVLVIEPDHNGWYKGWLHTVANGGTSMRTVTLPSEHIIELRKF